MEQARTGELQEGLPVLSSDGQLLGTVRSWDATFLTITRESGPDVWVRRETIEGMEGGRVRLGLLAAEFQDLGY